MYELRKGTMMLLTPNKKDVEMYVKAGWYLVEKTKTTKPKEAKDGKNNQNSNSVETELTTTKK